MDAPSDDTLRRAQTTMRSLVSDGASRLPALSVVADAIRLELERRGSVAILYVKLDRYGRLEPIFGWQIVRDILDAVAANLGGMVGQHAAPPRRGRRLHAHRRRLHRAALAAAVGRDHLAATTSPW